MMVNCFVGQVMMVNCFFCRSGYDEKLILL